MSDFDVKVAAVHQQVLVLARSHPYAFWPAVQECLSSRPDDEPGRLCPYYSQRKALIRVLAEGDPGEFLRAVPIARKAMSEFAVEEAKANVHS